MLIKRLIRSFSILGQYYRSVVPSGKIKSETHRKDKQDTKTTSRLVGLHVH